MKVFRPQVLGLAAATLCAGHASATPSLSFQEQPTSASRGLDSPIAFIENLGQWNSSARLMAQAGPVGLVLEDDGFQVALNGPRNEEGTSASWMTVRFRGASSSSRVLGESPLAGSYNFIGSGNDISAAPSYSTALYCGAYPGIDIRFRPGGSGLEYDLLLAPETDPAQIAMECSGLLELRIAESGELELIGELGVLRLKQPLTWQVDANGNKIPVPCEYVLLDEHSFGFEIERVDSSLETVVDPELEWSTYLGGSDIDFARSVAYDPATKETVVVGFASGPLSGAAFPTQSSPSGCGPFNSVTSTFDPQGFVTKFAPGGQNLLWSTFIGTPTGFDSLNDVAIAPNGDVLVSGMTDSIGLATGSAPQMGLGGLRDGLIASLASDGCSANWITYLGGTGFDSANAIAVHANGDVSVCGSTNSAMFPGGTMTNGLADAFVSRISAAGTTLLGSNVFGGTALESAADLAIDSADGVVVVGRTNSTDFQTTMNVFQGGFGGGVPNSQGMLPEDGFIARFNAALAQVSATYLGGDRNDVLHAVALGANNEITVAGETSSVNYPITVGAAHNFFDQLDGMVTRLDGGMVSLVFSRVINADGVETIQDIALDGANEDVVAVGQTDASNYPIVNSTSSLSGNDDGTVTLIPASGAGILFSAVLGGTNDSSLGGVAARADRSVLVVGSSRALNYPTSPLAFDSSSNGGGDAVVTAINLFDQGITTVGFASPACLTAMTVGTNGIPANTNASFAVECTGAPANAPGAILIGAPDAAGTSVFGVTFFVNLGASVSIPVNSDANGFVSVPVNLLGVTPGTTASCQFLWGGVPGGCSTQAFSTSEAIDLVTQ